MTEPILEMRGISKRFGTTQALADVSLALYPGEIHALLGENGAGKSTLIKVMTGIYRPDQGEVWLNGRSITINNPLEAQRHGIAAIHQEPMIFPDLNVAENIFMGHMPTGSAGLVDWLERLGCTALVVSLGVDAAADDPESPLQVTTDGYRAAGAAVGATGLPVVAVQEGGYHLDTLGALVDAFLTGLGGGAGSRR